MNCTRCNSSEHISYSCPERHNQRLANVDRASSYDARQQNKIYSQNTVKGEDVKVEVREDRWCIEKTNYSYSNDDINKSSPVHTKSFEISSTKTLYCFKCNKEGHSSSKCKGFDLPQYSGHSTSHITKDHIKSSSSEYSAIISHDTNATTFFDTKNDQVLSDTKTGYADPFYLSQYSEHSTSHFIEDRIGSSSSEHSPISSHDTNATTSYNSKNNQVSSNTNTAYANPFYLYAAATNSSRPNNNQNTNNNIVFQVQAAEHIIGSNALNYYELQFVLPKNQLFNYSDWEGLVMLLKYVVSIIKANFMLVYKKKRYTFDMQIDYGNYKRLKKLIMSYAYRLNIEREHMYLNCERRTEIILSLLNQNQREMDAVNQDIVPLHQEVKCLHIRVENHQKVDESSKTRWIRATRNLVMFLYREGYADNNFKHLLEIKRRLEEQRPKLIPINLFFPLLYYYNCVFVSYKPRRLNSWMRKFKADTNIPSNISAESKDDESSSDECPSSNSSILSENDMHSSFSKGNKNPQKNNKNLQKNNKQPQKNNKFGKFKQNQKKSNQKNFAPMSRAVYKADRGLAIPAQKLIKKARALKTPHLNKHANLVEEQIRFNSITKADLKKLRVATGVEIKKRQTKH